MKVQTLFIVASAICGVLAAPVQKREPKVVTITEKVVHVVTATSTIWVPAPTPTLDEDNTHYVRPTTTSSTTSTTSTTSTSTTPTTTPTPSTSSTSTTSTPTPTSTSTTETPVPTTTDEESVGGGSGGAVISGEATFYDVGLGSCGIQSSNDQLVVAISHVLMDASNTGNPNNNPLCGKKIKCMRGGNSVTAVVVDRCVGCDPTTLDLSPEAFNKLGLPAEGRIPIEWYWL
ncbi:RlpA-like double-psi beta-barrel-protein domain-containing protein-containing protein [Sphaerosporella brunnea]|uniref:RlpA-like double-psi beta-barrel-protein domain-containing protein-containing protein n=1 Tax=Sphaerosporella brunnea TaxID=1250544 RepID=A0A5J5EKH3_9PEZI|nr:RlpA-like double-psi beta-barrel-protein domain-containing protein-containing protein [Sphaerosporella brunnea]